jgi:phosphoribosylpyrophosphate synthetase
MKATPSDKSQQSEDDLAAEYAFDYGKAKHNRFAEQEGERKMTVVVLDEDVSQVFSTPEAVNKVLRALIEAMP